MQTNWDLSHLYINLENGEYVDSSIKALEDKINDIKKYFKG